MTTITNEKIIQIATLMMRDDDTSQLDQLDAGLSELEKSGDRFAMALVMTAKNLLNGAPSSITGGLEHIQRCRSLAQDIGATIENDPNHDRSFLAQALPEGALNNMVSIRILPPPRQ